MVMMMMMMMEHLSIVYSQAFLHCCFILFNPPQGLGSVTDQRFSRCSVLQSQSQLLTAEAEPRLLTDSATASLHSLLNLHETQ